jgi:hypothetical protein
MVTVALLGGANDPEIIAVRVPAKDVSKFFPAGSELRVMPVEKFNSLVADATKSSGRRQAAEPPRLLRARHTARLQSGMLVGQSEFVIEASQNGPADFVLQPWTPAVLARSQTAASLGARDTGQFSLGIDQAPIQSNVIEWELQPRSCLTGKSLILALPGNETTVLTLELPKSWVPWCRQGRRSGPAPGAKSPQENLWEIEPESGQINVHIYEPGPGALLVEDTPWVSGSTQIDLRRPANRDDGLVNWKAEWRLEFDSRNPATLEIDLDPALELIDVQGPAVRGYRTEPAGVGARLVVTLDNAIKMPTNLVFLAHARVPSDGEWTIPGLRPHNLNWIGGTTTVILDELHVLKECREKAGRRIFPTAPDSGPADRLEFESASPGSVAELVFRRPRSDSPCEVRGGLFIAGAVADVECELTWATHDMAMSEIEIDLSPTWLAEQVVIRGNSDPLEWHPSLLPSGHTRVHVALPAGTNATGKLVVAVRASSTVSGGRGPLELPRVRPIQSPILDEAWAAWVDQGTIIQPTMARGLAWIDPDQVPGLLAPGGGRPELREALAWRWIAEAGSARVDREPIEQDTGASVRMRARIDSAGERLIIDGRLIVYAGAGSIDSVPIWIAPADEPLGAWRFSDFVDDVSLVARPLSDQDRMKFGFPKEGQALFIAIKIPYQTEKTIDFHAEYSWKKRGFIPLLSPSRDYLSRGMVIFDMPPRIQSRVRAVGVRRLAAAAAQGGQVPTGLDGTAGRLEVQDLAKSGLTDAFAYTDVAGRLELFTEPLAPAPNPGIVREALLTTSVDPKGTSLNRLRLLVNVVESRALDFVVPAGITLVRVHRDGADVIPTTLPTGLSIPLAGSGPGSKSTTIVLDYLTKHAPLSDGRQLRPELPRVNLPCLSFVWEVIAPPSWRATDPGAGFLAIDRRALFAWPYGALAIPTPDWTWLRDRNRGQDEEVLRRLGDQLADKATADLTFGEWFSRWDSGPVPVLIDRVALSSAGLGPKSQCVPTTIKNDTRGAALATLGRHGLALVKLQDMFVITTEEERPWVESGNEWTQQIAEALAWGSDQTDRFQTLTKWRGEPSPKLASGIAEKVSLRFNSPPGWSAWSFTGPSWPEETSFVYLIDAKARTVTAWIVASFFLLVWVWSRASLGRWRFFLLAALMASCLLIERLVPGRYAFYSGAIYLVAFVLLLIELGGDFRRPPASTRALVRSESSLVRRAARAVVFLALAFFSAGKIEATLAGAQLDNDSAIVALFPYDGPFDLKLPTREVILRLADFNRLSLVARRDAPLPAALVRAKSAIHRVTRADPLAVNVDTEIELRAVGRGPFVWELPVSFANQIQVNLDGKRVPIEIEPGGARGRVAIAQPGDHHLQVRRSVAMNNEKIAQSISIPVNAIPMARVIISPETDGSQNAEVIARGRLELQPDRMLSGCLGPTENLEVRWKKAKGAAIVPFTGTVEALILWDITPAGDRVRTRFTCQQMPKQTAIRFVHQQGMILRSATVPGSTDTFCEEIASTGEWVLHVEPPLRAGSMIELDCWLPADLARGAQPASIMTGAFVRDLPRLEPVGVEKFSGALGVRRPGDWTGRFDPLPNTEPISDESFVESWGSLPQDSLTLCGTSRFVRECHASLQTGPPAIRFQVKPTIHVQIESGRVAISVDAEISELAGHFRHIQAEVPENIQIIEVNADGLSDWSLTADHRLHLIFDRPSSLPRRRLRVAALITLKEEPLQLSARQHQIKTPWFWWEGAEASAGFLTIGSVAKPEMRGSSGLTLISSESSRAGVSATPRHRSTYRVDDSRRLGDILWESAPARVSVVIESQMTIHPESAEWVAVLRYDVIGGALDAIRLRMPTSWATQAEIRLSGSEYQLTRETSGAFAFWTITPERPIWGSQRFVLRANRALDPTHEIDYPDISPLGQGAVDTYLAVADATDRTLALENPTGLQAIPLPTRFQAAEFISGVGRVVNTFRVNQKTWSLRVRSPRGAAPPGDLQSGTARLSLADLVAVVMPDRSILGSAVYDTIPGTGTVMSLVLPPESSLLWVTVDYNPVIALRSVSETWSIACDERHPSRIGVIWRTQDRSSVPPSSKLSVPLPMAGMGSTTTLLSLYTPPDLLLSARELAGLRPAGMARLEMARANWLAQSMSDHLSGFDRSSGRDHEKLVSLLISHEMALRAARRSLQSANAARPDREREALKHEVELVQSARITRDETVARAGLENDLSAARIYLGEKPASLSQPLAAVSETNTPERIRSWGRPLGLVGEIPGVEGPALRLELTSSGQSFAAIRQRLPDQSVVTSVLVLVLLLVTLASPGSWRWRNLPALIAAVAIAGYSGGPLVLVGAVGLATLARKAN